LQHEVHSKDREEVSEAGVEPGVPRGVEPSKVDLGVLVVVLEEDSELPEVEVVLPEAGLEVEEGIKLQPLLVWNR
jgi:hypothetical protein